MQNNNEINGVNIDPSKVNFELTTEQEIKLFILRLNKIFNRKITRRAFLGLSVGLTLDQLIANGFFRKSLIQLATNEEYQNKFIDAWESGELLEEDLPRLIAEITGANNYSLEIGEKLDSHEKWLDKTFQNYEVREVLREKEATDQLVLIAEIDKVDLVESIPFDPMHNFLKDVADFDRTVSTLPPLALLPRPQMFRSDIEHGDDNSIYEKHIHSMFASYQLGSGEIVSFTEKDGSIDFRGGALVLVEDNIRVVDASELGQFEVGKNDCHAIQVCAYVIRSNNLDQDLDNLRNAEILSGLSPDDPSYAGFTVTFETKNGEYVSFILSIYNHFDKESGVAGGDWPKSKQLKPTHAAEICQQILEEKGFVGFTLQIPDPEEFSTITSSDLYSQGELDEMQADNILSNLDEPLIYDRSSRRSLWEVPISQIPIPMFFFAAHK